MKKILIALLVLGQLVFADSVSNWCGYNGNLLLSLNNKYAHNTESQKKVVFVSHIDKKHIEKIKSFFFIFDYSAPKIKDFLLRHSNNNLLYELLNPIIPSWIITDQKKLAEVRIKLLGTLLDEGFVSDGYKYSTGNGILELDNEIIVYNMKYMLANIELAKKDITFTEEDVIEYSFNIYNGFKPCK